MFLYQNHGTFYCNFIQMWEEFELGYPWDGLVFAADLDHSSRI